MREKYGFKDKFVVMYAGVIGMAQGMDVVIEVALRLINRHDILFVLVGDGAEKESLVKKAQEEGLNNILFIPFQPVGDIPVFLSAADVLLVHLAPAPHRLGTIPAKVLAYMSMGRPLLVAAEGEAADMVKRSEAGLAVKPGNPDEIYKAVLTLYQNREMREEMGARGRKYAVEHFDRENLLAKLEKHLVEIALGRSRQ